MKITSQAPNSSIGPKVVEQKSEQFKETAQEFSSLFMHTVLKAMRQSIQKSELLDGGNAEDVYVDLLDEEYSKSLAKQSGGSLVESLVKQMIEINRNSASELTKPQSPDRHELRNIQAGMRAYDQTMSQTIKQ